MQNLNSCNGNQRQYLRTLIFGSAGLMIIAFLSRSDAPISAEPNAQTDPLPMIRIQGKSADRDGTAIPNAEVRLYRVNSRTNDCELLKTVATNQKGAFDLGEWTDLNAKFVPWSDHYLGIVRKAGYATMPFTLASDQNGEVHAQVILAPAATLRGHVVNQAGLPVEGATVFAFPENLKDARSAVTDKDGLYEIRDAIGIQAEYFQIGNVQKPKSRFPLNISHPDYGTGMIWYSQCPDEIDFELLEPALVEGRVVGPEGKPAAGITICLQSTSAGTDDAPPMALMSSTDFEGRYRFRAQSNGRANVFVVDDRRTAKAIDSLKLETSELTTAPDLVLTDGGYVAGRVLDEATGKPVRLESVDRMFINAHSLAQPLSGASVDTVLVQPDGSYRLRVPAGFCRAYFGGFDSRHNSGQTAISISSANAQPQTEVTVKQSQTTMFDFKVRVRRN